MAYGNLKDLSRKTTFNHVLCDKTFNTAVNPICNGYQHRRAPVVGNFFDKTATDTCTHRRTGISSQNQQLAEEIHKPIIRRFRKMKSILIL